MIKHINQQNFLTTAFVATKKWELQNVDNEDVLLLESVDSVEIGVALDYIDYTTSPLGVNSDCNIALEQQDADAALYQEGTTGSGIFYPDNEPQNNDGTFKRLVYDQTKGAFYNKRGNPTQMFGMDFVDFPLSKTNRNLSNAFRMLTIPRNFFGERIVENTVYLYDNFLDDNVEIYDDGYQNLIAGKNLFSKVQEVRGYNLQTSFSNIILSGSSNYTCPAFRNYIPTTGSDGGQVNVGFQYGNILTYNYNNEYANLSSISFLSGTLFNGLVSASYGPSTISPQISFYSGVVFDSILTQSAGPDIISTTNIAFNSGSIFNVLIYSTGSNEIGTISSIAFASASIFNGAVPVTIISIDIQQFSSSISFYSGSIFGSNSGSYTSSLDGTIHTGP